MATPRKRWFKCPDSVGYEPWSNDVLATLIRLQTHLNTRWARDGRSTADAAWTLSTPAVLMQLTGCSSLARARRILSECATNVSLTVSTQGANTLIVWPKWPDFQGFASDSRENSGHGSEPSTNEPDPRAAPSKTQTQTKTQTEESRDAREARSVGDFELTEPPAPNPTRAVREIWPDVQAAFVAYGKSAPKLTAKRGVDAAHRLRDHPDQPPSVLAWAVHGRMAQHQRGDYDATQHLSPESVFRPSKFWRDVEAYLEAGQRGQAPPFPHLGPPKRASERTIAERSKEIAARIVGGGT